MGAAPVDSSFAYCRRAVRRSGSNFALAFRLLPPPRRAATDALYTFFRVTDDLGDRPGGGAAHELRRWRAGLDDALAGRYTHRLHAALHHTVLHYDIDPQYLHAVLDGVEQDLRPVRVADFAELDRYCYRVASAVGLACLPAWGVAESGYEPAAEALGVAFQLTNILRDVREDFGRGRVYLPADECERFAAPPEGWPGGGFAELLQFQVRRAEEYYAKAEPLRDCLEPPARRVVAAMTGVYRELLARVAAAGVGVWDRRVRVPRWRKAAILGAAWVS